MFDRRSVSVAIVVLAAAVLIFSGARHLFMPAPPMLDRLGRAVAVLFVPGLHLVAAAVAGFAAFRLRAGWPARRAAAVVIAVCLLMALVSAYASSIAFVALHLVCYWARLCEVSPVPATALHAVAAATTEPVWAAFWLMPCVAAASWWAGQSRRATEGGS